MSILSLLYLLVSPPAFALPLKIFYEGKFQGTRLMVPCNIPSYDGHCFLDTAASASIFREVPPGAKMMGASSLGGIGWQAECRDGTLPELTVGSETWPNFAFTHCPTFNEFFNPVIGVNALWGRRFDFDFAKNDLHWRSQPIPAPSLRVIGSGTRGLWITMQGSFHGSSFAAVWDTGAPITLVTPDFVQQFPGAFVEETAIPLPPSLQRTGGKAYRVAEPIVVGGVPLAGTFVHAVNLRAIFGDGVAGVPVILGMEHIRRANWSFDLDTNWASVEANPTPATPAPERSPD